MISNFDFSPASYDILYYADDSEWINQPIPISTTTDESARQFQISKPLFLIFFSSSSFLFFYVYISFLFDYW